MYEEANGKATTEEVPNISAKDSLITDNETWVHFFFRQAESW